jgi:N-acetylglucosamine-6-sulfatase
VRRITAAVTEKDPQRRDHDDRFSRPLNDRNNMNTAPSPASRGRRKGSVVVAVVVVVAASAGIVVLFFVAATVTLTTWRNLSGVNLTAAAAAAAANARTRSQHEDCDRDNDSLNRIDDCGQVPAFQKPNIIVVLTDDLDMTLGGIQASTLRQTRRLLASRGKTLTNWFAQAPVCCPSRASLLTGRYFHNLRTATQSSSEQHDCMHVDVDGSQRRHRFWNELYFARYFRDLNYTVGLFGKHLNNENPTTFIPPGVDTMFINGGGSYIDPTFTHGYYRHRRRHNRNCTQTTTTTTTMSEQLEKSDFVISTKRYIGYSTSIIRNTSLTWIEEQFELQQRNRQPVFALISVKAPHIQDSEDGNDFPKAIPEPKYQHMVLPPNEQKAPRLPNYNFSGLDHHWVVRTQTPFTATEGLHVDALYRSRLRTLQSVDDMIVDLVTLLKTRNQLDNTYIVFTSDNGYRLGQFQMPQLKLHPYENDIRVPMIMMGPGIDPSTWSDVLASHVDLMPTLLGLATGQQRHKQDDHDDDDDKLHSVIPPTMDGTDLSDIIVDKWNACDIRCHYNDRRTTQSSLTSTGSAGKRQTVKSTTRSILIEYMSLGNVYRYNHLVDTWNHTFMALRLMLQQQPPTGSDPDAVGSRYASSSEIRYSDRSANDHVLYDLKYVEFRDSRLDWNFTKPPLEVELFDLARDPYELHNLLPVSGIKHDVTATKTSERPKHNCSSSLMNALRQKMIRMFHCRGESCRKEQRSGLTLDALNRNVSSTVSYGYSK